MCGPFAAVRFQPQSENRSSTGRGVLQSIELLGGNRLQVLTSLGLVAVSPSFLFVFILSFSASPVSSNNPLTLYMSLLSIDPPGRDRVHSNGFHTLMNNDMRSMWCWRARQHLNLRSIHSLFDSKPIDPIRG